MHVSPVANEDMMKIPTFAASGVFTVCAVAALATALLGGRTLKADEDNDEAKIKRGFDIAPVQGGP